MIGFVNGNAVNIPLADNSVHCVVTSPPYWSLRDYSVSGQLGLEPTPEGYIANMVQVFREVKRVLRDDGVLWLNIGDSYAVNRRGGGSDFSGLHKLIGHKPAQQYIGTSPDVNIPPGLKPLDLVGIPWRLAMALQADGWYLRSDIIWSKPNPMPESVNGWRWERHKVKVGETDKPLKQVSNKASYDVISGGNGNVAEWIDCPGCPICAPNDGLVLRRSAWRPTKAHEYVFLLSKTDRYFCDAEAVKEAVQDVTISRLGQANFDNQKGGDKDPHGDAGRRRAPGFRPEVTRWPGPRALGPQCRTGVPNFSSTRCIWSWFSR